MKNTPTCRIIIPAYKENLSSDERISLESVRTNLSKYQITFVLPEDLNLNVELRKNESTERFGRQFFDGIKGYNLLLKSKSFFHRFIDDDYILISQLDSLVLGGDLSPWMELGYDFLGAPWFKGYTHEGAEPFWRVGNGGFSLRKIKSHLRVLGLKTIENYIYPHHGWSSPDHSDHRSEGGMYHRMIPWYRRFHPLSQWITVEKALLCYEQNEDYFWSQEAPKFDSMFKVPSVDEALPFAFEGAPRRCLQKNGGKLPFGCHAWARYDRAFWEEVLMGKTPDVFERAV